MDENTNLTLTIGDTELVFNGTTLDIGGLEVEVNGTLLDFEGLLNSISDAVNEGLDPGEEPVDLYGLFLNNTDDPTQVDLNDVSSALSELAQANADGNATLESTVEVLLPVLSQLLAINAQFTVADIVGSPEGKWPSSLGSIMMVEFEDLWGLIRDNFDDTLAYNATGLDLGTVQLDNRTSIGPIVIEIPGLEYLSVVSVLEVGLGLNNSDGQLNQAVADARTALQEFDIRENAILSVVQYTDRLSAYMKALEPMTADVIQFTNQVARAIGIKYPATFTVPVAKALELSIFIRYFLDNIFGAVIALVVILGVLLIYSLLLNDVEAKTYEYGMLRALGLQKDNLIQILVTKSLMFSVPGICVGLLISFLCNIPVADLIAGYAGLGADYKMYAAALATSVVIGVVMPLVANIAPISRALSRTLRDSLDVYHHVTTDVTVRVVRLANLGIDMWQTCLSVLLIVAGFVTFYVIPYAFTFRNIPLFFGILNAVLLGMLLGLALIAGALQPSAEKGVLWLLLSWHNSHLRGIVQKNLTGHRGRNAKTAQMFTICLAFLVFAGTMFSLQATSLGDNLKVFFGADINISAPSFVERLDEVEMGAWLDREIARRQAGEEGAVVVDYAFCTYPLQDLEQVNRIRFGTLPNFPLVNNFVYGVPENFADVVYSEFFRVTESGGVQEGSHPRTDEGQPDVIKVMYTDAGNALLPQEATGVRVPASIGTGLYSSTFGEYVQGEEPEPEDGTVELPRQEELEESYTDYIDIVASAALQSYASVSLSTPLELLVRNIRGRNRSYMCKARGLVSKVPGFFFSSYRQTAEDASVLIRMDQYQRVLEELLDGIENVTVPEVPPKKSLFVKLAREASNKDREDTINGLRPYFKNDDVQVFNTQRAIESTQAAVDLLNVFFLVVGIIAMTLCFFILWLSFTANVRENAWEFGVLRAIGLSAVEVVMVYIYEAVALVLSSCVLGTSIGILISVSLTLQFNLFTELPFKFSFPTTLFCSMLSMALAVAVLGSFVPARSFLKISVSEIIRRS